jgi:hypothetical protein
VVAVLFTRVVIVIVTNSPGLTVPTVTVTVRAEVLVAAVPRVVVAPVISRRVENESVTMTFEAGAVPVFLTWMVKVRVSLMRAELGLTAMLIVTFGVMVPVDVGVGGVPVTVEVGVPGVPVIVGVEVAVGGVPVTVTVGVAVFSVIVRVLVAVGVSVLVSVEVIVGVSVNVGVEVSVPVICSGMSSVSPWIELALPGTEPRGFPRTGLRSGREFRLGAALEIDQVIRNSHNRKAVPTKSKAV